VALRRGETLWLVNSDDTRVVSFLRRGGGEEVLVVVNLSSQPWQGRVEVPAGSAYAEVTPAVPLPVQPGGSVPERQVRPAALPSIGLDAWGFRLFDRATR
jgi:hypothetical protein